MSITPAEVADGDFIRDRVPREERAVIVLGASPWLIFLVWPAFATVASDAGAGLTALALVSLAVFVGVYLRAFLRSRIFPGRPRWASTLVYTAVLVAAIAAMYPAAGVTALNATPFIVALWLFSHPIRIGLLAAVLTAAASIAVTLLVVGVEGLPWIGFPLLIGFAVMALVRFGMVKEESARVLGEQLVLSRQREDFARDIHDILGHSLTVVTVKAELAGRLVRSDPDRAEAELADILEISRGALTDVRSTVGRLRAPELMTQVRAARSALEAAGIAASLPSPGAVNALDDSTQELFAWCLREAVTNIVRHSGASRCTVTIEPRLLAVVDDGVGPGDAEAGQDGGLAGMRSRAAEASATLSIGPAHPGTRVEVRL